MDTNSLYLALAKKSMFVYEVRKGKSWKCYAAETIKIRSLQRLETISLSGPVVLNTENMTKQIMDCSRKKFDARKGCACVAKHTAVTFLQVTSLN